MKCSFVAVDVFRISRTSCSSGTSMQVLIAFLLILLVSLLYCSVPATAGVVMHRLFCQVYVKPIMQASGPAVDLSYHFAYGKK